jgi:hypothetical protein
MGKNSGNGNGVCRSRGALSLWHLNLNQWFIPIKLTPNDPNQLKKITIF